MITYIVRLVCIVLFTFVGILVCTAINDGIIELLGVVGLIGSGVLMSWESFRSFQHDTDIEIDSEYMSDSWMSTFLPRYETDAIIADMWCMDCGSVHGVDICRDCLDSIDDITTVIPHDDDHLTNDVPF